MEEHEERLRQLEKRFNKVIEDIDKSHLRKMQGDMHRCAANCCDNTSNSMDRNQNCVENCSVPLQNAQQFVQTEVNRLQNRWGRCIMECNDKMRDSANPGEPAGSSMPKLIAEFGSCAAKCIDAQDNLMHTARTNIERTLEKYSSGQVQ